MDTLTLKCNAKKLEMLSGYSLKYLVEKLEEGYRLEIIDPPPSMDISSVMKLSELKIGRKE